MAFPTPPTIPDPWPLRNLGQNDFDTAVANFYTYLENRQTYESGWQTEASALAGALVAANLPAFTAADAGKVVQINNDGTAAILSRPRKDPSLNFVRNGAFQVAQRGAGTFTASPSTTIRTLDAWTMFAAAGTTGTLDRIVISPSEALNFGNPRFFARVVKTGTGAFSLRHKIRDVDILSNRVVTLTFAIRTAGTAPTALNAIVEQDFGTGGTPSALVTALTSGAITVTSSWQVFSFQVTMPTTVGKTQGTNNDDHTMLRFSSLETGNFQFDITSVSIAPGPLVDNPTPLDVMPASFEVMRCLKAYNAAFRVGASGYAGSGALNESCIMTGNFPVEMDATPTITPTVAASDNVSTDPTAGLLSVNTKGLSISPTSVATGGTRWRGQLELSAELPA